MKDFQDQSSWGAAEPSPELLTELEVRTVPPEEMGRVRKLLDDEHSLGAGRAPSRAAGLGQYRLVRLLDRDEPWTSMANMCATSC